MENNHDKENVFEDFGVAYIFVEVVYPSGSPYFSDMYICIEVFALFNILFIFALFNIIYILLDIYQEYLSQIQGY